MFVFSPVCHPTHPSLADFSEDMHALTGDGCVPAFSRAVAYTVFKESYKRFQAALAWFQLDGFVTDHVNITMEVSTLYKHLAKFEPDAGTQSKLHKRRLRIVWPLPAQLSMRHFMHLIRNMCAASLACPLAVREGNGHVLGRKGTA
jgi:hypothetical protein